MPNSSPSPVVVIAPDSFKGSLSAEQVAQAIAAGIQRACPGASVRICPMADGGEGTLDAMLTSGGERRTLSVPGAAGLLREALTGLLADGSAIIETAEIVGITDPVGMGVPVETHALKGMDSLLSIVQMPAGIPVGTLAIGRAGAVNAALLAAAMLATQDPDLAVRLDRLRAEQTAAVATTPEQAPDRT